MEVLALTGTIVWFTFTLVRGRRPSGENLEQMCRQNAGKPSSWDGSAEQQMLHANDEINSWFVGQPALLVAR